MNIFVSKVNGISVPAAEGFSRGLCSLSGSEDRFSVHTRSTSRPKVETLMCLPPSLNGKHRHLLSRE